MKRLLYILALLFVVNTATAQFPTGSFNEVVEYCHIDIMDADVLMHRDYSNKITITKDSMKIELDYDQELNFVLGDFIYLPNGEARAVRRITNIEKPEQPLMGMYLQDKLVSIRHAESGNTIWFYLKNVCDEMPKLDGDGWFIEKPERNRQTDQ